MLICFDFSFPLLLGMLHLMSVEDESLQNAEQGVHEDTSLLVHKETFKMVHKETFEMVHEETSNRK